MKPAPDLTARAMAAMIEGHQLARRPADQASLIDMLARSGFTAAETIEHLPEAIALAGERRAA